MSRMPVLPLDALCEGLTDCEARVLRGAFLRNGKLRASKPFKRAKDNFEGCVNYVWRMICFDFADFAPHNCMPVTADCDIRIECDDRSARYDLRREMTNMLDLLIKKAEKNVPITMQKGILQWGRAFGMI